MATSIFRLLNRGLGLTLACAAIQSASAFSVFGPPEAFETATLDYLTRYYYGNDTELGAPKNYGEGSRLNTPIVTYGYDITFLTYFGPKGVAAVDSAMAVLNALPAASSANLSSFLRAGNQQINYTAQALSLTDLKSTVLSLMIEHMGLTGETHVWDLRTRNPIPATTCGFVYSILNRNYDPVTFLPSSYVNGVNYSWVIWDGCSNAVAVADAIEGTVDEANASELTYTAVSTRYGLEPGGYYLGLSYDDMGGLRYLYSKNNFAYEALDPTAVVSNLSTVISPWEGLSITNGGLTAVTGSGAVSNFVGFLGGVEKITYVKLPSNSLLGGGFVPRVFNYNVPWLTNGAVRNVRISRTVTTPDIIFSAADLVGNTLAWPLTYNAYARGFNFINSGAASIGGGTLAAVISPQETITFNDVTPLYINETPPFLDEQSVLFYPILLWGSFDGTTAAPTVYPNGSSISDLITELYSGSGPTSEPFTWSGLTLSTNPATGGTTATGGAAP